MRRISCSENPQFSPSRTISRALASLSKACKLAGIRTASIDSRMAHPRLSLRTYRLRDVQTLYTAMKSDPSIQAHRTAVDFFKRLILFRKWLADTFQLLYIMEVPERDRTMRPIGLVGFYRIKVGVNLWLSLIIFDPGDRERGYGRLALNVVLDSIRKQELAKAVYVEVLADNSRSLHFLMHSGFQINGHREDRIVLQLCLE